MWRAAKTDRLTGNLGSSKFGRSAQHVDRLKIVQSEQETPRMCLPALLAGFQALSVTLSISALLRGDNRLSTPSHPCPPPTPLLLSVRKKIQRKEGPGVIFEVESYWLLSC